MRQERHLRPLGQGRSSTPNRGPTHGGWMSGPLCGVCRQRASCTVVVVVAGITLLKDLCPLHLSGLLAGAREIG
jgi:hypothetical protein